MSYQLSAMRIHRTLPPAASPIYLRDIISGLFGLFRGKRELDRFERELRNYFGMKHCFLVSSGKAALTLILRALKELHPDRDEVLIPAFTCYSVPSAIVRAGLKVRLCDINTDTLDFDFDQLSKILSRASSTIGSEPASRHPRPGKNYELSAMSHQLNQLNELNKTKQPNECNKPDKPDKPNKLNQPNKPNTRLLCIIPTHLFGIPSDIGQISNLLADPEVTIVEDAAQAMGGEWNGRKLGTCGDVSFFSLGRGKAFSTVEGGIIITDGEDLAGKIARRIESVPDYSSIELISLFFKGVCLSFFLHPLLFWLPKSIPFLKLGTTIYDPHFKIRKMSAFQAGLTKAWQRKLKKFKQIRTENSEQWSVITQRPQLRNYCSGSLSSKPINPSNRTNPGLIRFPLRVEDDGLRVKILMRSNRTGLGIMPTYPDSIDGIQDLRAHFQGQRFPAAKQHAKNLLTLPTHSFITQKDKWRISALISELTHPEP